MVARRWHEAAGSPVLLDMSFTRIVSLLLPLGLVAGCIVHDPPPPPPDQVHDMAIGDLDCPATI